MHQLARILSVKRLLWYNLLFWTACCLLQLIQGYSYAVNFGQTFQWTYLIRYPVSSCLTYWILSYAVFDLYLATRKLRLRQFIPLHLLISLVFGFTHKALTYINGLLLERLFFAQETKTWRELLTLWQQTYFDAINGLSMYWLVLFLLFSLDYWQQFRDQSFRAMALRNQLTEAQLQSMKMQMQPHFLFNALNTIAMMVRRKKEEEALEMIIGLSEMLRHNLSKKRRQLITLEEELTLVNHYLAIEKVRYQDRLQLEINMQEDMKHVLVPNLILQPIVENAFKHGIAHSMEIAILRIAAYARQDMLVMEVYNSSDVSSQDWIVAKRRGIGLSNTIDRLMQLYHGKAKFQINEQEDGVLVCISLPVLHHLPGSSELPAGKVEINKYK